jgi:hypothetical protein
MNKPLIVLGTPFGGWFEYARELRGDSREDLKIQFASLHDELYGSTTHEVDALQSLAKASSTNLTEFRNSIRELLKEGGIPSGVTILSDTRLIGTAGVIASEIPAANFLIFVESPRAMVARTLGQADPAQLLESWIQSAKFILSLAHRFRSRVRVLDVQECLDQASAFANYIRKELGLDSVPPYPRQEPPMALERALADLIVAKNQQASRLYLEILALSHPLDPNVSAPEEKVVDLQEAIREIEVLRYLSSQSAEEMQSLEKQVTEAQMSFEGSRNELTEENDLLLLQ